MVRATSNGAVLGESDDTVVVEGNNYFPPDALRGYLAVSDHHSVCTWKGLASYHDIVVNGKVNRAAAWNDPDPRPAAEPIRGRVAFWHGVRIEADDEDAGPLARLRRRLTGWPRDARPPPPPSPSQRAKHGWVCHRLAHLGAISDQRVQVLDLDKLSFETPTVRMRLALRGLRRRAGVSALRQQPSRT